MSHDERREGILRAALEVFAEKGFHGATTRALAEAAGVSEALLFRHFPSKEDLYGALQTACFAMKNKEGALEVEALEAGTASLVTLVHYLTAKMLRRPDKVDVVDQSLHRLLANSYLEDGAFARGFMKQVDAGLIAKLDECIREGRRVGDLVKTPVQSRAGAWLVEHLVAMLMLNQMPGEPVVSFGLKQAELVEQTVWFALLGLGVKAEVIKEHYRPQAFALLMS
ncbi:TetR/AcrR family transcriptional regulator [Phragmitibacter flavus]|uniref:TetR/AcrR family transcriptional regulator n=1 Tax=Phragmitibacter flavus TaxID=2576071 RepID=A0A5R8KA94_9BACT|nr:TetR/AcrR family transcriptional regulator [Phragmitibacter flavus]TLD68449.1 TetR/AcrR family transcriptional regulator [Phragmitibacter flavus]